MIGQTLAIARRTFIRLARQPAEIAPAIIFPLFFFLVISAGLDAASSIPGFPASSYRAFVIGGMLVQGAMINSIDFASGLAIDVQSGFLDRLALTPVKRPALLIGRLAGSLAITVIQVFVILGVGFALGVRLESGPAGVFVILALALVISLAFNSISAILALRLGNGEAVQGMFPLFFIFITFTTLNLPKELITATWFRTIATYNPATYMIEGLRSLVISGYDTQALAKGFGIAGGVIVIGMFFASSALRKRVART